MSRSARRLTFALLLASCLGGAAGAREPNVCAQTSKAARTACDNQARTGFWVGVGNCLNLGDAAARRECRLAAKRERSEASAECDDQFDARQELCDALGPGPYEPVIDPARFLDPASAAARPNPYLPLVPGRTWTYQGGTETVTVTVTGATRLILGVTCTVVRDVVEEVGVVVEDTSDYFAQDQDGNVWYFGEVSQSFEGGALDSLGGSWRAGVDGAKPGIVMKAAPMEGDTYRQEFALGEAEDAARVISVVASETVPAASCNGTCIQTLDFTPLEPDAQEHKFYAPGVGMILEVDLETGDRVELMSFTGG